MARSPREEAELCLRVASALKTSAVRKGLGNGGAVIRPKNGYFILFILSFYVFKHLFIFFNVLVFFFLNNILVYRWFLNSFIFVYSGTFYRWMDQYLDHWGTTDLSNHPSMVPNFEEIPIGHRGFFSWLGNPQVTWMRTGGKPMDWKKTLEAFCWLWWFLMVLWQMCTSYLLMFFSYGFFRSLGIFLPPTETLWLDWMRVGVVVAIVLLPWLRGHQRLLILLCPDAQMWNDVEDWSGFHIDIRLWSGSMWGCA